MRKKNSAPTMKDVAMEAGVALGTVSKVINGLPVGETYRLKVEEAIHKLNYQVNSYAQGLKANRTNTIAMLIPNTMNPYFAELTHHINIALAKRKYRMLLCCTDFDRSLEQEYVSLVRQKKVDGIIGLTYNPDLVIDADTPFVSIDRCLGSSIPCIASDNFSGGQIAAQKLAELGCSHVAFLRTGSTLTNEPNKRRAGFENGCMIHNLTYECLILEDGDPYDKFEIFLKEHMTEGRLAFDGIFCATDYLAYQINRTLTQLGICIPKDVQLIGFDGIRAFSELNLICSTIMQPIKDIAEMCVEFVLQENMTTKPPLICLPVHYAAGGTTSEAAETMADRPLR